MKKQAKMLVLVGLMTTLSGCTSASYLKYMYGISSIKTLKVVLRTQPAGATLYSGGTNLERCSNFVVKDLTEEEFARGSVSLVIPRSEWPSGASKPGETIEFDFRKNGLHQQYVITHPDKTGLRLEYDNMDSHRRSLLIESVPTGAEVVYKGAVIGKTPTTLHTNYPLQDFHGDRICLGSITIRWSSGATLVITNHYIKCQENSPHIMVKRPMNVPGIEQDMEIAAKYLWDSRFSGNPPALTITIKSDPSGATIYKGERNCGTAPSSFTHNITYEDFKAGEIIFRGLSARWISGTVSTNEAIMFRWQEQTHDEYTFIRPLNTTGIELDVRAAIEHERMLAENKRQEQEKESQRKAQELQRQQYEAALAEERTRQAIIAARQAEAQKQQENLMLMGILQQNLYQQQLFEQQQQQQRLQMLQQFQPRLRSGSGTIYGPNMQTYQLWWNER